MNDIVRCPKCGETSGNDWSQCGGSCPMPMSPHFKAPAVVARLDKTTFPRVRAAFEKMWKDECSGEKAPVVEPPQTVTPRMIHNINCITSAGVDAALEKYQPRGGCGVLIASSDLLPLVDRGCEVEVEQDGYLVRIRCAMTIVKKAST